MAIGMVLKFNGGTTDQYDAVNDEMGLGPDELPEGATSHWCGTFDGGIMVCDTWESQEKFDAFMGSKLGPASGKVGIPQPEVTACEVYKTRS